MGALAGFWVLSLLTYGYLSWGQGLEEEEEGALRAQTGERLEPSVTAVSQPHLIFTEYTQQEHYSDMKQSLKMEKQLLLLIRHKFHVETIAFFFLHK